MTEDLAGTFSHHVCRLDGVQIHDVIGGRGDPCDSAPGALRAGFAHYRAFPEDARQVEKWSKTRLQIPVLALGSEISRCEITARLYRAVANDVRPGVIARCGHWVAEERPDELIGRLLAFFEP